MGYVISPPPVPSLRVVGSADEFPVRRIYCIGRNYAEHAIEMGHDPNKEPPFFFQKNPDNLLPEGRDFPYPPKTEDVHFEIELVVALKSGGTNIAAGMDPLWSRFASMWAPIAPAAMLNVSWRPKRSVLGSAKP